MNGIKTQYILAVALLFGVALFSFYSTEETKVQETYKEVPKDYLKQDRSLAQVKSSVIVNKESKPSRLGQSNRHNLVVKNNRNKKNISNKQLIKRIEFVESHSTSELRLVKNLKAVLKSEETLKMFPDSPQKGNFIIVGVDEIVDHAQSLVVNTTEKEVGIFFDVVKIKLKNDDQSEMFSSLGSFEYELLESYDHLNLYTFKFKNSSEAIAAYEQIKEKGFAKRASLEIKYYFRTYR